MGFRDLRASLAQFNLVPIDPEAEREARIDRIVTESLQIKGLESEDCSIGIPDAEEWTVVYDKFQFPRR